MADKPKRPKQPGQAEARQQLKSVLEQARAELQQRGFDSTVTVASNRDGSIDAELFVKEPRGKKPLHVFRNTRESLPLEMPGVWLSTGARFEARRDEDNYHRHKSGMSQGQTYYQRYTQGNAPSNMLVGQKKIAERIEKSQRKKVDGIFVRLHWNAGDTKPGRAEAREDRKKRKRRKKRGKK